MTDKDDGASAPCGILQLSETLSLETGVADGEYLVDQENLGLEVGRDGESQAQIHAGGVVLYGGVEEAVDLGECDDLVELAADLGALHAQDGAVEIDVFAAHLEPEILLIDEVLAVGDAGFQRKCLGKLEDTARSGRTVIFVSHDLAAVRQLVGRACMFEEGGLRMAGPPDEVIRAYLSSVDNTPGSLQSRRDRKGTQAIRGVDIRVYVERHQTTCLLYTSDAADEE